MQKKFFLILLMVKIGFICDADQYRVVEDWCNSLILNYFLLNLLVEYLFLKTFTFK